MKICDYGCGQDGKYQFKNGKLCCKKTQNSCIGFRKKLSLSSSGSKNSMYGKKFSEESKEKLRQAKLGKNHPFFLTISKIKRKYPLFSEIEEMRYNPDKPGEKEIQVHCKYNECKNSKEKGGWFTSTKNQLYHRSICIENPIGFGESNFYCSEECKFKCELFNLKSDPFKITDISREIQPELRQMRLKIDKYTCQKCKKHKDKLNVPLHCHHIEGILWEPLESADLDKVITYCETCHKKVHRIEGCKYIDMKCGSNSTVEFKISNLRVAGSNPVSRSI